MGDTLSAAVTGSRTPPSHPYLVLILECGRPLAGPARWCLAAIDRVDLGRGERRRTRQGREEGEQRLAIEVADGRVSATHARLTRIGSRFILEDLGSKNGTRVNHAPQQRTALVDGDLIEVGETFWLYREHAAGDASLDVDLDGADGTDPGLTTIHPALVQQFRDLAAVSTTRVPVIVEGESGTGKELAARAIHRLSGRGGPFVAINCGALSPSLLESELFGHRRGAFSGATEDRPGLVRAADGGTLFLDELGDLPPAAQAHLLRVLQEGEVLAVGATAPVPVDVRIVAATNKDVSGMVAGGSFRSDLYARLAGFRTTLPPLRARLDDLGLLIRAALTELPADQRPRALTLEAGRCLVRHPWPLNIRELRQALWAAAALAGGGAIDADHLPRPVRDRTPDSPAAVGEPPLEPEEERLRSTLVQLLDKHRGNLAGVARELDKDRTQIRRWLRRFGIDPRRYRC